MVIRRVFMSVWFILCFLVSMNINVEAKDFTFNSNDYMIKKFK